MHSRDRQSPRAKPIRNTVAVKGDRMWQGNDAQGQIIDLSKQTITTIDFQKKTWSVMTFAEMVEALNNLSNKMKHDQQQQTGGMVITTHIGIVPQADGYGEVRDFQQRLAEKLNWTPGASAFGMGQPGIAQGMTEVYKEAAKLDGMPVLQETKMTMEGQAAPQASQPPPPSATSVIGGALAGRFGLGRKKQDSSSQNAGPNASATAGPPGSLLEMTTEIGHFSAAPVSDSRFEVPAGYKQKDSDLQRVR